MSRYLNIRTVGLALVAGAALLVLYPDAIRYLPFLLLAACPLSMLFMHGRGGHQGHAETASSKKLAEYVCPMHAEVRSTFPGRCPVCGMALEPTTRTSREPGAGGRTNGRQSGGHEDHTAHVH